MSMPQSPANVPDTPTTDGMPSHQTGEAKTDTHFFGFAGWSGVAEPMSRPHRHDDIELNVVMAGDLDYLFGGRRVTVRAGTVAMFWAALPHQVVATADQTFAYWLTIPLRTVLGWRLRGTRVAGLLSGTLICAEHAVVPHIAARLDQWIDDVADAEDRREIALLELHAFVQRVLLDAPSQGGTGPALSPDAFGTPTAAMATFVAHRFRDPIRIADVAAAAHLHPHYAMEVFRHGTGATIGSYITQCRLAEAQRLLITTSLSVAGVAAAAGFGSTGRFYAAWDSADLPRPAAYRRINREAAGWAGT